MLCARAACNFWTSAPPRVAQNLHVFLTIFKRILAWTCSWRHSGRQYLDMGWWDVQKTKGSWAVWVWICTLKNSPLHWGIIRYHGHSRGLRQHLLQQPHHYRLPQQPLQTHRITGRCCHGHSVGIARIYTCCVCNFSNISRASIFFLANSFSYFLLFSSLVFISSYCRRTLGI